MTTYTVPHHRAAASAAVPLLLLLLLVSQHHSGGGVVSAECVECQLLLSQLAAGTVVIIDSVESVSLLSVSLRLALFALFSCPSQLAQNIRGVVNWNQVAWSE